tara:strand:- start:228 stop:464 length:237 start_codon:yes stop_codon:yes gene_type:complete
MGTVSGMISMNSHSSFNTNNALDTVSVDIELKLIQFTSESDALSKFKLMRGYQIMDKLHTKIIPVLFRPPIEIETRYT